MKLMEITLKINEPDIPKGDIKGFRNEVLSETYANPFAEFELVWENKAAFELHFERTYVQLSGIRTLERGKGHGSEAMRWICNLADKYGVTMKLWIQPFGAKPKKGEPKKLNMPQLKEWYKRFGFQKTGKNEYSEYIRYPKNDK